MGGWADGRAGGWAGGAAALLPRLRASRGVLLPALLCSAIYAAFGAFAVGMTADSDNEPLPRWLILCVHRPLFDQPLHRRCGSAAQVLRLRWPCASLAPALDPALRSLSLIRSSCSPLLRSLDTARAHSLILCALAAAFFLLLAAIAWFATYRRPTLPLLLAVPPIVAVVVLLALPSSGDK